MGRKWKKSSTSQNVQQQPNASISDSNLQLFTNNEVQYISDAHTILEQNSNPLLSLSSTVQSDPTYTASRDSPSFFDQNQLNNPIILTQNHNSNNDTKLANRCHKSSRHLIEHIKELRRERGRFSSQSTSPSVSKHKYHSSQKFHENLTRLTSTEDQFIEKRLQNESKLGNKNFNDEHHEIDSTRSNPLDISNHYLKCEKNIHHPQYESICNTNYKNVSEKTITLDGIPLSSNTTSNCGWKVASEAPRSLFYDTKELKDNTKLPSLVNLYDDDIPNGDPVRNNLPIRNDIFKLSKHQQSQRNHLDCSFPSMSSSTNVLGSNDTAILSLYEDVKVAKNPFIFPDINIRMKRHRNISEDWIQPVSTVQPSPLHLFSDPLGAHGKVTSRTFQAVNEEPFKCVVTESASSRLGQGVHENTQGVNDVLRSRKDRHVSSYSDEDCFSEQRNVPVRSTFTPNKRDSSWSGIQFYQNYLNKSQPKTSTQEAIVRPIFYLDVRSFVKSLTDFDVFHRTEIEESKAFSLRRFFSPFQILIILTVIQSASNVILYSILSTPSIGREMRSAQLVKATSFKDSQINVWAKTFDLCSNSTQILSHPDALVKPFAKPGLLAILTCFALAWLFVLDIIPDITFNRKLFHTTWNLFLSTVSPILTPFCNRLGIDPNQLGLNENLNNAHQRSSGHILDQDRNDDTGTDIDQDGCYGINWEQLRNEDGSLSSQHGASSLGGASSDFVPSSVLVCQQLETPSDQDSSVSTNEQNTSCVDLSNNKTVAALLGPAGAMLILPSLLEVLAVWFTYIGLVAIPFGSWLCLNAVTVLGLGHLGGRVLNRRPEFFHRSGIIFVSVGCAILWVVHSTLLTTSTIQIIQWPSPINVMENHTTRSFPVDSVVNSNNTSVHLNFKDLPSVLNNIGVPNISAFLTAKTSKNHQGEKQSSFSAMRLHNSNNIDFPLTIPHKLPTTEPYSAYYHLTSTTETPRSSTKEVISSTQASLLDAHTNRSIPQNAFNFSAVQNPFLYRRSIDGQIHYDGMNQKQAFPLTPTIFSFDDSLTDNINRTAYIADSDTTATIFNNSDPSTISSFSTERSTVSEGKYLNKRSLKNVYSELDHISISESNNKLPSDISSKSVAIIAQYATGQRTLMCMFGFLARTMSVALQELIQIPMGLSPRVSASVIGIETFILSIIVIPLFSSLCPGIDWHGTMENLIDTLSMMYNNWGIMPACMLFITVCLIGNVAARDLLMNLTGLHLTLMTFIQLVVAIPVSLIFIPSGASMEFRKSLISIPLEVLGGCFCLLGLLIYGSLLRIDWKPPKHGSNEDQENEEYAYMRATMPSALIEVHTAICRLPSGLPLSDTDVMKFISSTSQASPTIMTDLPYMRAIDCNNGHDLEWGNHKNLQIQETDIWRWSHFQLPPSSLSGLQCPGANSHTETYWASLQDEKMIDKRYGNNEKNDSSSIAAFEQRSNNSSNNPSKDLSTVTVTTAPTFSKSVIPVKSTRVSSVPLPFSSSHGDHARGIVGSWDVQETDHYIPPSLSEVGLRTG